MEGWEQQAVRWFVGLKAILSFQHRLHICDLQATEATELCNARRRTTFGTQVELKGKQLSLQEWQSRKEHRKSREKSFWVSTNAWSRALCPGIQSVSFLYRGKKKKKNMPISRMGHFMQSQPVQMRVNPFFFAQKEAEAFQPLTKYVASVVAIRLLHRIAWCSPCRHNAFKPVILPREFCLSQEDFPSSILSQMLICQRLPVPCKPCWPSTSLIHLTHLTLSNSFSLWAQCRKTGQVRLDTEVHWALTKQQTPVCGIWIITSVLQQSNFSCQVSWWLKSKKPNRESTEVVASVEFPLQSLEALSKNRVAASRVLFLGLTLHLSSLLF